MNFLNLYYYWVETLFIFHYNLIKQEYKINLIANDFIIIKFIVVIIEFIIIIILIILIIITFIILMFNLL